MWKGSRNMVTKKRIGLKKGDILKGKYEVLALIGEGGMSRVFLARDLDLVNKQWAIKEVDRRATDPLGRPIEQSLASEAELLSKLSHPAIVDIVDIEKTENFIYVVMDHIEGTSLDKVIRQKGPQSEEDVQKWMLEICDALNYLHRQNPPIIYRDMKPNNIMLHPDGYVKLIDLGVAREYKDEQRKDTIAFGTTGYAAPEQYGKAQTDARTDIYGTGATMWHLLGGTAPPVEFPLPNVREANPNVGEGFADVIIPKCTALERDERYQTIDELTADLEIYKELTREYKAKQKHKVMAFGGFAGAFVLFLILGIASLIIRDVTINKNYESYLSAEQYGEAIKEKPGDIRAYEKVLSSYLKDGKITQEEWDYFNTNYWTGSNIQALEANKEDYAKLCNTIGKDLWYNFEVDKNETGVEQFRITQKDRILKAYSFFKDAVDNSSSFPDYDKAELFANYGECLEEIRKQDAQNADTTSEYKDLWGYLETMVKLQYDSSAYALENYSYAVDTLVTKYKEFAKAGITQDKMEKLLQEVKTKVSGLNFQGEDETGFNTQLKEFTLKHIAEGTTTLQGFFSKGTLTQNGGV